MMSVSLERASIAGLYDPTFIVKFKVEDILASFDIAFQLTSHIVLGGKSLSRCLPVVSFIVGGDCR
jgi:hypothetical protein